MLNVETHYLILPGESQNFFRCSGPRGTPQLLIHTHMHNEGLGCCICQHPDDMSALPFIQIRGLVLRF